ncbi:hypothetical protein G6F61_012989 [Rhizopus arrhizus]|nr:hypothetical protein G6F61_012989 [Rhizopus arrhizus]
MLKHFDKTCKKINNIRAAANALRLLLLSQASSTAGNIEIYTFIYLKKCSQQSIIIKFWGQLLETFFTKRNLFLQWGETIPETCMKNEPAMKMDLRMIFEGEDMQALDGLNGKFAKISATNKKKYYDDKTKLVLAGKCHLNQLVMSLGGTVLSTLLTRNKVWWNQKSD